MSQDEINIYIARAKQLRSEAIGNAFAQVFGWFKQFTQKVFRCIVTECGKRKIQRLNKLISARLVWE